MHIRRLGLKSCIASAVAGALWTAFSPSVAFLFLAGWMFVALVVLAGLAGLGMSHKR